MRIHETEVSKRGPQWRWICRCGDGQLWSTEASAYYGAWRHLERETRREARA